MTQRPVILPIASLREGMMIDLEEIIDWLDLDDCPSCEIIRMAVEFEFATVDEVVRETDGCVCVYTSQGAFGLSPDILVGVIYPDEAA